MNQPSSLPSSVTSKPAAGIGSRVGSIARDAAPTLGAYLNIIRARKWLVVSLTILITLLAAVVVNMMTPIYRASVTLLIENNKSKIVSFEELYGVPAGSREFFQTQAEFMKSREVASRVVNELNLETMEGFDPRQQKPGKIEVWLSQFEPLRNFLKPNEPRLYTDEEVAELALSRFKNNLEVVPVRLSQLVEIRFENPDPFLAAKIANQTAESYITADLDARFNMQQTASKWLNDRLLQLRGNLEESERALQQYREQIGLVATPSSSMGGNVKQLDSAAEKLIQARIERSQIEQVYRQVASKSANRYEVPAVFNNPAVVAARAAITAAERKLSDASQSLGLAHPEYKAAQTELKLAQDDLKRQAEGVISSISKQYEVARSTERALESAVAASRGNIQDINRKEGQLNVLERDVATNQQIYQTFLAKVKETDATSDFRNPIARIVDPAVPPIIPVKPPKAQVILLAAMLGALLAAMVAIALDQSSAVIRSTDEVEDKLGIPLLVAAPKVDAKLASALPRMQHDQPQALFSEAIRSALTGVRLALMHVERPVVAVTSTLPGEGKSTIALNFAIEQARTKKTLLIDADMRKPSIAKMLGVPAQTKGLSELFQNAPMDECIQFAPDFQLSLILAGGIVKNPHDWLMSPRFAEIVEQLRADYEMIVIDTPPVELVSDALPIGLASTGVIYVVKSASTAIPMVRRSLGRMESSNVTVLGIVLNQHDFSRAGRYYGEYSAYGSYGKGYYGAAYGDPSKKMRKA
ncbi:MAG: GumC family protein [Lautropia sp.]